MYNIVKHRGREAMRRGFVRLVASCVLMSAGVVTLVPYVMAYTSSPLDKFVSIDPSIFLGDGLHTDGSRRWIWRRYDENLLHSIFFLAPADNDSTGAYSANLESRSLPLCVRRGLSTVSSGGGSVVIIEAYGWPALSFYSVVQFPSVEYEVVPSLSILRGMDYRRPPDDWGLPRVAPTAISIPSFVANVLLVTAALSALVLGIRGAWTRSRSHHRRRAGRCTNCAYSLKGSVSNKCPECGHHCDH